MAKRLIYFFTPQVFMPINVYSGQKLTRFVATNTPAMINKTTLSVPVIIFVKYKRPITTANNKRTIRSIFTHIFFHTIYFRLAS